MMSILIVTASKPRADSKLGFNFKSTNESTTITKIDEKSIFANTNLRVGHKILTINQMVAHQSMSAVLASIGSGEVTIVVENSSTTDDNKAIFKCIQRGDAPKAASRFKTNYYGVMSPKCPSILTEVKLPRNEWLIIHALIIGKLMPMSVQLVKSVHDYKLSYSTHQQQMAHRDQAAEVNVSRGMDACILQSNANLVALSVKDQINSITKKFGVMAMLESECIPVNEKLFSRYDMSMNMNIPIGFSFHLTGDRAAVPIN